jgi:hypothetical protein
VKARIRPLFTQARVATIGGFVSGRFARE